MRLLQSLLLKKISGDPVTPEIVPLTFTNISPGSAKILLGQTGSPTVDGIQYRLGTEGEWTEYTTETQIDVANGESIQFQNVNERLSIDQSNYVRFSFTKKFSASGSLRSMLNYSNEVPEYAFYRLFYNISQLTSAPLMDFDKIGQHGCQSMFELCSGLTSAPELPATEIESYCYQGMFSDCVNLVSSPTILPATALFSYCYQSMFVRCTKLTTVPELPSTNLASYCYRDMFWGCSSLTEAPELPANILATYCYYSMFYGCSKLTKIKVGFKAWNENWQGTWVTNVSSTGEFECPPELPIEFGNSKIPTGWIVNGVGNIIVEDQTLTQSIKEPVNFTPQYTLQPNGEVQFSIYSGSLPDGLTLNSDGSITGQVSEPWNGQIVIQISGENYFAKTFTLTISLLAEGVKVTPNNLTSNTSNPDFVVSQRTTVSPYDAWKAMDGDISTFAKTQYASSQYDWWQIDFLKPVSVIEVYFKCQNESTSTRTYLEYSDDGITFYKYDENVIPYNAEETRTYVQGAPHRYYRFLSTLANYYIQFYEIRFNYMPVDKYIGIDDFTIYSVIGKEINKQLQYDVYPSDLQVNFSITEGTLPAGLTLDSSTGTITGTPTEIGEFNLTITMSAEGIESVSSSLIIKINEEGSVPTDAVVYLDGSSVTLARTGQVFAKGYSSSEVATTTVNGYDVLHFSGDTGCLVTTHDVAVLPTGNANRAISLWAKPDKTTLMGLVSYGQNSNNNTWQFAINNDKLKIGGGHNASNEYVSDPAGISPDEWRHCLINKIGFTEYLYINGELVGQFTYTRDTLAGKVVIGAGQDYTATTSYRFKGYMTGIRIFDRSLDTSEILALSQEYTF